VGEIPAVPEDWVQPFAVRSGGACDDDLLMLPLTSSFDPAPEVASARYGTLLLWAPPRTFAALLAARLAAGDLRHLAFALRTDVALDGGSLAWAEENLAHVSATFGEALEWVTPSEARERLLPDASRRDHRDAVWPRALRDDELRAVAHQLVGGLQAEELARLDEQRRAAAAREELEAALAAAREALAERSAEAARLADELAVLEGTATWRLHQRLLPLLRPLRRSITPRGGRSAG
jgi:hypothetical protein